MTYSSTTELIAQTPPTVAMGAGHDYQSTTTCTEKREALSTLGTISCVTGSKTCPVRPSNPCMCTATSSSTQGAQFGARRIDWMGPLHTKIHNSANMTCRRRVTFSNKTSDRRVQIVLTTCESWTLTPPPTNSNPLRNVSRTTKRKINRNIWRHASKNGSTSHLLWFLWMASLA